MRESFPKVAFTSNDKNIYKILLQTNLDELFLENENIMNNDENYVAGNETNCFLPKEKKSVGYLRLTVNIS